MTTFFGVPLLIRGEAWGNLYLTEKRNGGFDDADVQAVTVLADWAAIAIEHARLYRSSVERSAELERAVRDLRRRPRWLAHLARRPIWHACSS
jgi:GAF domain-containing protein